MVKKLPHALALIFALVSVSCHLDFLGFVYSSDLDTRLNDRNTFNFLTQADRNLSLGDTFTFVVVGDTHIHRRNAYGLELLAGSLIASDAFVVVLGDITENGRREDVARFIEIANGFGIPAFPVIGNHDVYFGNWPVWRELIGSTSYRVNGNNVTLFILDTANGFIGRSQLDWLERELRSAAQNVFVFTHANLFVHYFIDTMQLTDVRERARLTSMLAGRATAMFMGHTHKRGTRNVGGVKYINMEDFKSTQIFCRVRVSPEGISYTFVRM